LGQLAKSRGVVYGNIGQDSAVKFDAGLAQTMHKLAIADVILTSGGIDASNPQAAKIALTIATIPVGIYQRFHHGFVSPLEQAMLATSLPFGQG
jgi:hypothetical protein